MTYATPKEVRNKLKQLGNEIDDIDLQDYLEKANVKMQTFVGREYHDQIFVDDTSKQTYKFEYSPLINFNRVEKNKEVDSSNYTIKKEDGEITFDSSYVDSNIGLGDVIDLYYIPEIFKHLEIVIAKKFLLQDNYIMTSSDQKQTDVEQIDTSISSLVNRISGGLTGIQPHKRRRRWI